MDTTQIIEYILGFILGGALIVASKAATDALQSPLLGAVFASLPLQYITVAFLSHRSEFKPYFLSSVFIEIGVTLSLLATWAVIAPIQNHELNGAAERSVIIIIGLAIWALLSTIVYLSTKDWDAVKSIE